MSNLHITLTEIMLRDRYFVLQQSMMTNKHTQNASLSELCCIYVVLWDTDTAHLTHPLPDMNCCSPRTIPMASAIQVTHLDWRERERAGEVTEVRVKGEEWGNGRKGGERQKRGSDTCS